MSKMSELDADRQQIERLTDVVPPPSVAESKQAGVPAHTPTPWRFDGDWYRIPTIFGADGKHVASVQKDARESTPERAANADLIIKAVNNHDALVGALTDALCELTACATQLAVRGLKGREGDSVSRAQKAAREALAAVKERGQ